MKMKHARRPRIEFRKSRNVYVAPGVFQCEIPPRGSGNHDHFEEKRGAPPWGSPEWVPIVRQLALNLLPLRPDSGIDMPVGFVFGEPSGADSIRSLLERSVCEGTYDDGERNIINEPPNIYLLSDGGGPSGDRAPELPYCTKVTDDGDVVHIWTSRGPDGLEERLAAWRSYVGHPDVQDEERCQYELRYELRLIIEPST